MNNIIKYENNGISLDARIEEGQAWLTYEQTAELFGVQSPAVIKHVAEIISDKELPPATTSKLEVVRTEGNRSVNRDIMHLNQDMVVAIGYRVRSERGIEFRRYVTAVLKGEAPPMLTATKPMTAIQLLAAQGQALAELGKALSELEQRQLEQAAVNQNAIVRLEKLEHSDAGMMTVLEYWESRGTPFDCSSSDGRVTLMALEKRAKNISGCTRADVGRKNRAPTFELSVLRDLYKSVHKEGQ